MPAGSNEASREAAAVECERTFELGCLGGREASTVPEEELESVSERRRNPGGSFWRPATSSSDGRSARRCLGSQLGFVDVADVHSGRWRSETVE